MYYVIMVITAVLIFVMYFTEKNYAENQFKENRKLEAQIWNNELKMDKIRALADEQNWGIENLKAGRTEVAYENFVNVKDEIERLANKKELDTAGNDNV